MPPRVFVSSVFASLGDVRFKTYYAVESRGWEVLAPPAEKETATWSTAQLKSWCVKAAAQCDLYIGLFWHRYGSLDHASLPAIAWTEIEYWEAVRRDKARLLYFFTDSPHPPADLWQRHLRSLVRLTGKGAFARIKGVRRASFDALLHRDLDAFAGSYFHRSLAREAVSHAPLEIAQTPYWPAPAKGFDTGALEEGIDAMRLLYSKAAYVQALATGAEVLSALLRFPPDAFPAARGPWARFLVEWDRAGSWVGIDGVVPSETDTLWACRERLRVLSLMGRTREAYAAAGGIASALYRRGKAAGALYWLDIAHRDPESARTAGACSTRASMLMSVGEWQEAEALLKRSLDAWARQGSPVSLVKDVAKFGFIEAKWRKSRRGAARIDEALGMGPTGHPGFLAQVLGLKVQAAIALGDRDAATSGAQRFVRVCREHHLWHQLSGLRRPLDELGLTPTQRS